MGRKRRGGETGPAIALSVVDLSGLEREQTGDAMQERIGPDEGQCLFGPCAEFVPLEHERIPERRNGQCARGRFVAGFQRPAQSGA